MPVEDPVIQWQLGEILGVYESRQLHGLGLPARRHLRAP